MSDYRPPSVFNVEMILLNPNTTKINGVVKKTYPDISNGEKFYGSFRTFGGTEVTNNGVYSIMVTAVIDTYFNPNIKSNCRVAVNHNGEYWIYEIITEPENIGMKNRYLQFKVERLKGEV